MDSLKSRLPKISNQERTPLVDVLLELLAWQEKQIDALKQEIFKLKDETTKPNIKPSKMDEEAEDDSDNDGSESSKPKKGPKRSKTEHLKIDATIDIQPDKQAGLSVSQYVHADDTGARHDGKNGYCTHIGNELFA